MAARVIGGLVGVGVVAAGAVVAGRQLGHKKKSGDDHVGADVAIQMHELPDQPDLQKAQGQPAPPEGAGAPDAAAAAEVAGTAAAVAAAAVATADAPAVDEEVAGAPQDAEAVKPEAQAPADQVAAVLKGNERLLSSQEVDLVRALLQEGQEHIFEAWPAPGTQDPDKRRLVSQLAQLDGSYHGGLVAYIRNAKQLLKDSKDGRNAFDGFTPSVPEGESLDFCSGRFLELEERGLGAVGRAAFVLVAGGLGERLGYSGIKVALPTESATGCCFLQLYIEYILALQERSGAARPLPLAIMTSDDTHDRTRALLDRHNDFGMAPGQITLMKQEKVACLTDNDAHLALTQSDPFAVQTKPHGHGDVHALLHSTGLAKRWREDGMEWVCFFQDTNALVFRALLTALGVSAANSYDMNSLAVPRKAKESIGAIARLVHSDGVRSMTVNVEYNQLDPLLRATTNKEGDVNDDKTGFSPFPGNINQLVIKLDTYVEQLAKTGGVISEFINPKYKDATKTAFKSSTRLECMMQDYPQALPPTARVGFTVINQVWATYSPVKNSPGDARAKAAEGNPTHSATVAEMDIYKCNAMMLQMLAAADVGEPQSSSFNGIPVEEYPRVVLSPAFAPTLGDLKAKVSPRGVVLAPRSVLVVEGRDIILKNLRVDGALVLRAHNGARVEVDGMTVSNKGWTWAPGEQFPDLKEEEMIRGFRVVRHETQEVDFKEPGDHLVPEGSPAAAAAAASAPERKQEAEAQRGSAPAVAAVAAAVAVAAAAVGGEGGGADDAREAAKKLTAEVFASVAGAR